MKIATGLDVYATAEGMQCIRCIATRPLRNKYLYFFTCRGERDTLDTLTPSGDTVAVSLTL